MNTETKKDFLALVIALIFVGSVSYFGYSYFNQGAQQNKGEIGSSASTKRTETEETESYGSKLYKIKTKVNELIEGSEEIQERDSSETTTNYKEEANYSEKNEDSAQPGDGAEEKYTTPQVAQPHSNEWTATDYVKGDIKVQNNKYEVKSGDTLWEIAEAVYGNGSEWVNILSVNADNIGYLNNGQQALTFPGQIISIPVNAGTAI